jgi:hypothetical protein
MTLLYFSFYELGMKFQTRDNKLFARVKKLHTWEKTTYPDKKLQTCLKNYIPR